MATPAQILANKANAQLSSGPSTSAGQAIVGQNNFRHGLAGSFQVLPWENQNEFDELLAGLTTEHQPATPFEFTLVTKMSQHFWLAQRALVLQDQCFSLDLPLCEQEKQLALYLRYQTVHDRAFYKSSDELRKLRNEKRKVQIGFESQKHRQAAAEHKQLNENRKQELHKWAVLLAEAKLTHRQILNVNAEFSQSARERSTEEPLIAQKAA